MEKVIFAYSSNFPTVVDDARISLCRSVAFNHTYVPKSLQEVRPGVGPQPVPDRQSDFMFSVIVSLAERRVRASIWAAILLSVTQY